MSKKANTSVNNAPIAALAAPQYDADEGYTTILGEHRVKQVFHDSVVDQFFSVQPLLLASDIYEPAELCGEQFWAALSVDERRLATLCLRHIAIQFEVPWFMTTCRCCGKVYFSTSR